MVALSALLFNGKPKASLATNEFYLNLFNPFDLEIIILIFSKVHQ